MTRELTTTALLSNLGQVMSFVDQSFGEMGVAGPAAFAMKLAIEEICTNIMSYAYPAEAGPIHLVMEAAPETLTVRIADRGTPFRPEDAPEPDLTSSAEERRIGGLGIHLVRQMLDEVEYRTDPVEGNTLRLVKNLEH